MANHLLIAGTGRAGTSFLVRYLTELGLDTNLSRAGAAAVWDDRADAGLEDLPLPGGEDLPYVIKSPWTCEFVHELLERPAMRIDAAIVPMRNLTEAAASRCILEIQAQHERLPWMAAFDHTWEHVAHTPGGMVFSTNPVDQARLLAVGFHVLLEGLVKAEVPIIFLSFPRLIEDAGYLYRKLSPILPASVTAGIGLAAHRATAEPCKVRVGAETRMAGPCVPGFTVSGPAHGQLDRAALLRLLAEARRDHAAACNQLNQALQQLRAADEETIRLAGALDAADRRVADVTKDRDRIAEALHAARQEVADLTRDRDCIALALADAESRLSAVTAGRDNDRTTREADASIIAALTTRLASIEGSTTWRFALMLQTLGLQLPGAVAVARRVVRFWPFPRSRVEPGHATILPPRVPAAHAHRDDDRAGILLPAHARRSVHHS